jgi:UDP-glucose 4-epimerase
MAFCLVTGGAGFIGSHLVEALLAHGHRVRVLDNLSTGHLGNLAQVRKDIELVRGDLTDLELVREAAVDVEYVFHQGALNSVSRSLADPLVSHHACATGTLHVLMAAREAQVRRVIYGASANVYGNAAAMPVRESGAPNPLSPYAVAKLAGGAYCVAFHHIYGLETVQLRAFNVFGPRQSPSDPYSAVIPFFLDAMLAGRHPVIHGDGHQSRDFTYVTDVVQASLLAMEAPRVAGHIYNIASGRSTTLLELVEIINDLLGRQIKPIHDAPLAGDVRHSRADISRAQVELGFCPCTDLRQNLLTCIAYYTKHAAKPAKVAHRRGNEIALAP